MGNVVNLNDHRPHNSGQAKCLGCKHEWHAVVPVDTDSNLECPNCGLHRGEFNGNFYPTDADVYECTVCGNDLWIVMREGVFCRGCSAVCRFEDL